LELRAGTAARHGLAAGVQLLELIAGARLSERGNTPR